MATKVYEKALGRRIVLFVSRSSDGKWNHKGKKPTFFGMGFERKSTCGIPWRAISVWIGAYCGHAVRFENDCA